MFKRLRNLFGKKERTVGDTLDNFWKKQKKGTLTNKDLKEALSVTNKLVIIITNDPEKFLEQINSRKNWEKKMEDLFNKS